MNLMEAIISGVIQGITEFFPISSSGHLVLLHNAFGMKEPQIAFDIFLHLGTLVSILIFFWKDIHNLFGKDRPMLILLAIASIPTFAIGITFEESIEKLFSMPKTTGLMLMITGIWLGLASFYNNISKENKKLGLLNSFIIGVAQGVAIIPGISRSGATIATGMLTGLDKETSFRFAFLLAIPAILGASVVKASKISMSMVSEDAVYFIIGGLTAMAVGNFAIRALLRLVERNQLYLFGVYCLVVGGMIVVSM